MPDSLSVLEAERSQILRRSPAWAICVRVRFVPSPAAAENPLATAPSRKIQDTIRNCDSLAKWTAKPAESFASPAAFQNPGGGQRVPTLPSVMCRVGTDQRKALPSAPARATAGKVELSGKNRLLRSMAKSTGR